MIVSVVALVLLVAVQLSANGLVRRGNPPACCKRALTTSTKVATYKVQTVSRTYYVKERDTGRIGRYKAVFKYRNAVYEDRYKTEIVPAPACPKDELICCSGHLSVDGNCVEGANLPKYTNLFPIVKQHHPDWSVEKINQYLAGLGKKRQVVAGHIPPNCKEYKPTTTTSQLTYYTMAPYTYYSKTGGGRMGYRSVSHTGSRATAVKADYSVAPMKCDENVGGKCLLFNKSHTQSATRKLSGTRPTGYKRTTKSNPCRICRYKSVPSGYETYYFTDTQTVTTNPAGNVICCGLKYNFKGNCIEATEKALYEDLFAAFKKECPLCPDNEITSKIGLFG